MSGIVAAAVMVVAVYCVGNIAVASVRVAFFAVSALVFLVGLTALTLGISLQ